MNPTAIFIMQATVSLSLVMFSIGMLATQRGETSVYLPLLSGIVSAWLPSPQAPKALLQSLGGSPAQAQSQPDAGSLPLPHIQIPIKALENELQSLVKPTPNNDTHETIVKTF